MNDFFWVSGHLGWELFAVIVFTGLWWLVADVFWRMKRMARARFARLVCIGWLAGIGLILLGCWLAGRIP